MPKKAKESPSELKLRAKKIYTGLNKLYPNAHCELDFKNPLKNMSNSIDVLIACYNEGPTYDKVDLEHLEVLKNSKVFDQFQKTVLNDGSTDNSRNKITALANESPQVQLVTNE